MFVPLVLLAHSCLVVDAQGVQNPQDCSQLTMNQVCLQLVILPKNVPTAFWQYSGSLGLFLSMHGVGGADGGDLGGRSGGGVGDGGGGVGGGIGDSDGGGGDGGGGGEGGSGGGDSLQTSASSSTR